MLVRGIFMFSNKALKKLIIPIIRKNIYRRNIFTT